MPVDDGDGDLMGLCEQLQLDLPDVACRRGGGSVCRVSQCSCGKQTVSRSLEKGLRWSHLYDGDLLCNCRPHPLLCMSSLSFPASLCSLTCPTAGF